MPNNTVPAIPNRPNGLPVNWQPDSNPGHSDGLPAAPPPLRANLTNNLAHPDESVSIGGKWGGNADPVPPHVCTGYWASLYNRADSFIYQRATDNKAEASKRARESGETWELTLCMMIKDIVLADKPTSSAREQERKEALRRTREKLPVLLYRFMEVTPYRRIRRTTPGIHYGVIWYGYGNWATDMRLDMESDTHDRFRTQDPGPNQASAPSQT
ncbi:hypothetical protein B0T25DRAFT_585961 [Lasiosphaeria hispida]|uniref:Uncharacterized protein n=1 Tax=Lasiosphaeria hispida TaxID=260671 RepID=A0AAJ0H732_9PEZI|nr:hypothetical protein B0T25DRAFT_585961 [Lasiosphaeria hispida]